MEHTYSLNLLVIDDEQLLAENLIGLLKKQDIETHLGFLDDKEEFTRALRQVWDVVVLGHAYDLSYEQVLAIINEHGQDLPVIVMLDEETDSSNQQVLTLLQAGAANVYVRSDLELIAIGIQKQLYHLRSRRKVRQLTTMLHEAEHRANILIKNSKSAVAYIDEGVHIFANDPYLKLFNYNSISDLMGMPVIDLIAGKNVADFKTFLRNFIKGNREEVEFLFESVRADGSTFEAKLQLAPATYEGEPCTQIIIQQQNQESAELYAKLAAAERSDPLTGLGNRLAFEESLTAVRQHAISHKLQNALLYIKLDNIGQINASAGILGLDNTVKSVANVLTATFEQGQINRFADSIFTVLLMNVAPSQLVQQAEQVREKIANMLIDVNQRTVQTTASIAVIPISETSPDEREIMQRAIDAVNKVLMQSNNQGNGVHVYDPAQHATGSDAALYESLVNALEKGTFSLLFQPIYDIDEDSSNFFEVFVRLPLPDGTLMTPDQFLDTAKRHNMLDRIDRWVLINACKRLKQYRSQDSQARILVHLSEQSLQDKGFPDFVNKLSTAVGKVNQPLSVQFSERDVTTYLRLAKGLFAEFKRLELPAAIHNFGSSVKSIDLLEHLNPAFVRLSRSYVSDLGDQNNVDTIKKLIADIAEHDVDTLMAFIEDPASMSAAWTVGARFIQGKYLQEPLAEMGGAAETEEA